MNVWALSVLLCVIVAALDGKVAQAMPSDLLEEDDGFQEDEADEMPSQEIQAPVLRSSSLTLNPQPGDTVLLPCDVDHAPNVVWLNKTATIAIGSRRLTYKDDQRMTFHGNNSLEIRDVQPTDSGSFVCRISQGLEVVHHLKVNVPPRISEIHPAEKEVHLQKGQHITFRCTVTGQPLPKVVWTRKGKKLPNGKSEHHGDHLHLSHLSTRHMGEYVCNGSNSLGSAHETFALIVSDVPEIELEKDIVNTEQGEDVEISCVVHAYPAAGVEWTHNNAGNKVIPSDRINLLDEAAPLGRRYILRIARVTQSDFGSYSCLARNSLGSARRSIKLQGTPAPALLENVEQGGTRGPVLIWKVESIAPITKYELMYRRRSPAIEDWSVEEPIVEKSNGHVYFVRHELSEVESTEYEAVLKSQNSYGWSELSPKFPFHVDASRRAASSKIRALGSGAPADSRICFILLLGAVLTLVSRS